MGRDGQSLLIFNLCASLESQEPSDTASLRDLMAGRCLEVIGREIMGVVSRRPASALQGEAVLDIEQDAKVKK